MPQPCDQRGHLHAGQLPTLAGLGPLGDLDLQLFAGVQIFRRHAKAARGHLLDLGARVVAIRFRHEMRRIFTTLARVTLRANAVHRHVQRLVRLWAQRPQAHARRHKPLADRGDAFHLLNRHRLAQHLDVQQIANVNRRIGPHRGGILLPDVIRRPVTGRLQHMHRLGFPSVLFARPPRLVDAANRQHIRATRPALGVHLFDLHLQTLQTNARNPALHAGEIFRHHGAGQTHSLKVQTPAIG